MTSIDWESVGGDLSRCLAVVDWVDHDPDRAIEIAFQVIESVLCIKVDSFFT